MNKIHNLPDWFAEHADALCAERSDNFLGANTIAYERKDRFFFDGVLGALLSLRRIPTTIEIALDLSNMSCLMRVNYGSESDDEAAYGPFEVESFALLWNADPKTVHGLDEYRIKLFVGGENPTRYPIVSSSGVMCELFYRDGKFLVQPDVEFANELLDTAA